MAKIYISITFILALIVSGCATHKLQIRDGNQGQSGSNSADQVEKRFLLIGDAGNSDLGSTSDALIALRKFIENNSSKKDFTIFLGDNIYERGLPDKNKPERALAEHRINEQFKAVEGIKGDVLFVPGNHDWYSDGLKGLKRQEEFVEKMMGKNSFQPEKGCPIEKTDVTDNIVLLVLDTQWYLAKWDDHPTINDDCEIKSRNDFFLEIEGELKKNNEKTILMVMHHPAFTNGPHGGSFSFKHHIFPMGNGVPLPVLGSVVAQLRSQGGVSPQDRYNNRYNELMDRLTTMARSNDRLIFVSGHEHSLQYIEQDGLRQIVSGSGSKTSAASLSNNGLFSYGGQGFAVLNVYKNGSSDVSFYSAENGDPREIFSTGIYDTPADYSVDHFPDSFESRKKVAVYDKSDTQKSKGYAWFWGNHYRHVYGTEVEVPVATLDTLMGGLTIERKGGGHQTRSLRLTDKHGRNFALRAVKKSAVQFLQTVAFKDTYVEEDFRETLTEATILDFYTSSHPYATFVVPGLSDAIGLYHTNPLLLYVPKHKALGKYNKEFGDELYVIEERPDDGFLDVESFGKPDAIESSSDVLKKIRKDEKYQIDEPALIKARLFDILVGDWDRHMDQWRWSRFDISDDKRVYRPIPRDRDQVFSNYDGALIDFLKFVMPITKQFQEFDEEQKDVKWINVAGIKMDRAFIQTSTRKDWIEQARFIQNNLTDAVIDEAFGSLPREVQDDTSESIKEKLKIRRENLVDIAGRYYDELMKLVIVTGTDKDDHFEILRENDKTIVNVVRIKGGEVESPFKSVTVISEQTNEVWIYGLDDDDKFVVNGSGSNPVLLRIIGGQNNDIYHINNGRRVKVYDHRSKPNTIEKRGGARFRLNDIYNFNTYDFTKYNNNVNTFFPSIGFNPDDGMRIGFVDTYTVMGFNKEPYHRQHGLSAGYYFATQGFDIHYEGIFANTFGSWDLVFGIDFTSENFSQNFFGFGNETLNREDDFGMDYNRVKKGIIGGSLGVARKGEYGSLLSITVGVEQVEIEETPDRFIALYFSEMREVFDSKTYGHTNFTYSYKSADNAANPSRGMNFQLNTGIITEFDDTDYTHGYIKPSLSFYNAISRDRKLVLHTKARGHFNVGDMFEFYHAANLGANSGLRGYRTERFSGNSALALGADLRYQLAKFNTGLLPLKLGIFGGYDYGRVWVDDEDSDAWHDSIGGGLLISAVDAITGNLSVFNSDDGMRISFGFGLSF